jgi:UDP-2,3-diacylglucosamine hydrolase
LSTPTIAAPATWRAIDFLSDLHLAGSTPRTAAAWRAHLLHTEADAVVILGDLFEVWVGDDARTLPFEAWCVRTMAEAATRLSLMVMVGNRDFLMGPALLADCGAVSLSDPTVIEAFGVRTLVAHGDAWCLSDVDYQQFRRVVRGEAWQRQFLGQPLASRQDIAAGIRRESASRRRYDGMADADLDPEAVAAALQASAAAVLVHGHTHRPGSGPIGPGVRHVLSDWDLDRGDRAEVLRWTRSGFERLRLDAPIT